MPEILLLLLLALGAIAWHNALERRETAIALCHTACRNQGFQLLDGSVHLAGMGLARCMDGRRCLRRRYRFAYSSDHLHRSPGVIIMLGQHAESIVFSRPSALTGN